MLADYYFSSTTAHHLAGLENACPYRERIIRVPFYWNDNFDDVEKCVQEISTRLHDNLLQVNPTTLSRKANRNDFMRSLHAYKTILQKLSDYQPTVSTPEEQAVIDSMEALCEDVDRKYRASLTAVAIKCKRALAYDKAAAAAHIKCEELRLLIQDQQLHPVSWYFSECTHCSALLDHYYPSATPLHVMLHADYCMSDKDSGKVGTTQQVWIEGDIVRAMLSRWLAGKVSPGQHVGSYVVKKVPDLYAEIGCHVIPRWNLEQLAWELIPKEAAAAGIPRQFPDGMATFAQVLAMHADFMRQYAVKKSSAEPDALNKLLIEACVKYWEQLGRELSLVTQA